MKRTLLCLSLLLSLGGAKVAAQPQVAPYPYDIHYFLPQGDDRFDPKIPLPKEVLGFEVGQQHVDWNNVLMYMRALDSASDRVSIQTFGQTNEYRPFIQVTITSPANQKNLEAIRQQHLQLTDLQESGKLDTGKMPLIVNYMYSIHGNEPSGTNSSLAMAYYLTALQGAEADSLLDNLVVVLTPGQNPDGLNRFASWVNSARSHPDVADYPDSREFTEPWPSSRTNHYWADCNRDWLMVQQPEGQNALEMYFRWLPNVVVDFHEQGGDRSYYFSPGHPKRTSELMPQANQDFTSKLTHYAAKELDKIGTLYFSKEGYDDYYIGKGAAYGDIHGSVCILCEQLASRGHLRTTKNYGLMSFAETIRNQAFSGFGMLKGALALKAQLLDYQRGFYQTMSQEAGKAAVQGYLFNARGNRANAFQFLQVLKRHRVEVYRLSKQQSVNGKTYRPDDSYVIPCDQKYYKTVRTLMEDVTHFEDSTFYDISTWTFPHAFNLQYTPLKATAGLLGERVDEPAFPRGEIIGGQSEVGYLFENTEFYAPKIIYELLRQGLIVKVSNKPFTYPSPQGDVPFHYGTILVPAQYQCLPPSEVYALVKQLSEECGVRTYAASQGLMADHDLGGPQFKPLTLPRVAIIVGRGMGVPDSGEAWMLLGKRLQMPPVLIECSRLPLADLSQFNTIILNNGVPTTPLSAKTVAKLRGWVEAGGTLIATGKAYRWTNDAKLTHIETVPTLRVDSARYLPYEALANAHYGDSVDGVILQCRLDKTNPLAWGYDQDRIALFRNSALTFKATKDPYASPISYLKMPDLYLSGCISEGNLKRMAGQPAVIVQQAAKGRVIVFADDLNFRSYWYGTSKLFLNAIFFGGLL
ncbi:MAG: peptidase M14 [Mediterranea sp.]|jgi:hypothetical protein|nr:peptidase M14 [Mediterranea sp.]